MSSGTAQVSSQVCQFFCQFCVSSCACDSGKKHGKLRKLWNSLSELRGSLCERRLERGSKLLSLLSFSVRYDVTR